MDPKLDSAIEVVTSDTVEVSASDIEDSIEEVAIGSTVNKLLTSSCATPGHTGNTSEGNGKKFSTYCITSRKFSEDNIFGNFGNLRIFLKYLKNMDNLRGSPRG